MNTAIDPLILVPLLAIAAKNLVEMLKHFANVGGDANPSYTRLKGLYTLAAPAILAVLAAIAENQGVALNLLGQLGVKTDSPLLGAIISGIVVGLAAPEAYDLQGLLKAKVRTTNETAVAVKVNAEAQALIHGIEMPVTPPPSVDEPGTPTPEPTPTADVPPVATPPVTPPTA